VKYDKKMSMKIIALAMEKELIEKLNEVLK